MMNLLPKKIRRFLFKHLRWGKRNGVYISQASVSEDRNSMAIGVCYPSNQPGQIKSGETYVFQRIEDEWLHVYTIRAPDKTVASFFGYTVELNSAGTELVVHSISDNAISSANDVKYHYERVNDGDSVSWELKHDIQVENQIETLS